ncbi:unnamed protein product [Phyllotreta striolata]|uniref:Uncharacterized protein n=1 Tax=Phyllotreta striolata TaxID=444603 RepID=A0A9N9XQY2_PHYSR|nr:unnamed protein product [Phyllotreta striolata]
MSSERIDLTGEKEKGRGNYTLRPRAVMYPMAQDTTGAPQKHNNFIVINVGKAAITAEVEYGTREIRLGVLAKRSIQPGEEVALELGDGKFEVTALKITNATKTKAAFQVEGGESVLPKSVTEHYSELLGTAG